MCILLYIYKVYRDRDRQTGRQTDRQIDSKIERQTDRLSVWGRWKRKQRKGKSEKEKTIDESPRGFREI